MIKFIASGVAGAAAADELQKALVFDMEAPKPPEGH